MLLEIKESDALPLVQTRRRAASFTREQIAGFASMGDGRSAHSPSIKNILHHIIQLRGEQVTWAFDLPLPQLFGRPAHTVPFCRPTFVAPLTIFKIAEGLFIPKIIFSSCDDLDLDLHAQIALGAACRCSSIETLCITEREIAGGYLKSGKFKRAFYGAFFCDAQTNRTVYCPTLRNCGHYEWPVAGNAPGRSVEELPPRFRQRPQTGAGRRRASLAF